MINFRYHVISLTAVFLALAIGLVLGTTALNGQLADQLKSEVDSLRSQNTELRDRVNHLTEDVNKREDFADQIAPAVLTNKLAGKRVVLLSTPSGNDHVDGVVDMLTLAGATITGRVQLNDKFTDPARNDELLDLAHVSLPPSITGTLPTNTDGVEASTALLAAVLLDRTPAVTAQDMRSVLTSYKSQGYIGVPGEVTGPAQVAVLVSGPPATDGDAKSRNNAAVTVVDQLDKAGEVVVAASGVSGDGNVVSQVRGDPQLSTHVSTVDNVSTPQGRLVTALAIADQLTGKVGKYGLGPGATLLPKFNSS